LIGTWIDIDLDAVKYNYAQVTARLTAGSRCMAVVKADAYGLGAAEVAYALQEAGCAAFAVTSVAEGLGLRGAGIKGVILVLGPSVSAQWPEAIQAALHLTVATPEMIEGIEQAARDILCEVSVHLKLETGMGRTGLWPEELARAARLLTEARWVKAAGVYTHFARAAQRDDRYTRRQYEIFERGVEQLAALGVTPSWRHVCNSAALLSYPQWHHDFVRSGTLLIGHYPHPALRGKISLRDPWQAKSTVQYLRQAPRGAYVGYQSLYKTRTDTELAVIPAGYADGFGVAPHLTPQGLLDLGKVLLKNIAAYCGIYLGQERVMIKGRPVKIAGKIGMQLTILDVGNGFCQIGDEVVIPLRRTLANPRLPRRYWSDGRVLCERRIREEEMNLQENTAE
jgi:alanine racemase